MSDKYATSCTSSPYRVMIACDVSVEPAQTESEAVSPSFSPPYAES